MYLVPLLRFNLAETTSAWSSTAEAQLGKTHAMEAQHEENPAQWK